MVFELFLMGDTRFQLVLYFVIGLFAYLIEYKKFRRYTETEREAKFSKGIAFTYMIGSATVFLATQVIGWGFSRLRPVYSAAIPNRLIKILTCGWTGT